MDFMLLSKFQFLIGRLKTDSTYYFLSFAIKVSIPHRQAKNFLNRTFDCFEIDEFQFLIGRLKTHGQPEGHSRYADVSIPHRQAKNRKEVEDLSIPELFQFLIGRLKTAVERARSCEQKQFQFLIGRLKTSRRGYHKHRADTQFQFLIGRLKTCTRRW